MRTTEEIREEIKKGEEFIKDWPVSAFGDDNVATLEKFKELSQRIIDGEDVEDIEEELADEINDYDNGGDRICRILDWLGEDEGSGGYY